MIQETFDLRGHLCFLFSSVDDFFSCPKISKSDIGFHDECILLKKNNNLLMETLLKIDDFPDETSFFLIKIQNKFNEEGRWHFIFPQDAEFNLWYYEVSLQKKLKFQFAKNYLQ